MKTRPPALAHLRFERHAAELAGKPLDEVFGFIHESNLRGAPASASGVGSEIGATARLREALPALLIELGAESLLDIPCGDFHWLSQVELPVRRYIGADIVPSIIEQNHRKFSREFLVLDLCSSPLPPADVVLCRDCLVHLSFANIARAVDNLKRSGSVWLLTTTFPECEENLDIADGDWRMLNCERPPFAWPAPRRVINEGCLEHGGAYADKSLALWRLEELPRPISSPEPAA